MLNGPERTVERARKLRKEMSLPEVLLWRELRKRPGGFKFRRQHPAGPYVADFFCQSTRLIIEIDGEAHDRGDRPILDEMRDAWFADRGFVVMRVPAKEVLTDVEAVVLGVVAQARAQAQNPPLRGEGDRAAQRRGGGVSDSEIHSRPLTPLRQPCGLPPPLEGEDL